jgi:hypothetical protein
MELSVAEIGLIRWYRGLYKRMRQALEMWLLTGYVSLMAYQITHQYHQAAA